LRVARHQKRKLKKTSKKFCKSEKFIYFCTPQIERYVGNKRKQDREVHKNIETNQIIK
jgi:hypothetical protein